MYKISEILPVAWTPRVNIPYFSRSIFTMFPHDSSRNRLSFQSIPKANKRCSLIILSLVYVLLLSIYIC